MATGRRLSGEVLSLHASDVHPPSVCDAARFVLTDKEYIVKEGIINKRGKWNRSWKQRFFVLDGRGRLSYFKSQSDSGHPELSQGSIPIFVETEVEITARTQQAGPVEFVIRVPASDEHSGRTFELSADTADEAAAWVSALKAVANQVLFVSFKDDVRHW
mmetsp:Transcript_66322/g.177578  ORF Transcript_66322/g.177578 Transcript_66322/m.177578 type:complete len:160 (+) Transcript_66322:121-600(+)